MPTGTHNGATESAFTNDKAERPLRKPPTDAPPHSDVLDRVEQIAALLEEKPVNLARVSDEIRAQPELAAIVRRTAASTQISHEYSADKIEQAVVMLGTEHLRALLNDWRQQKNGSEIE